jgi:hypothetical protein
VSRFLLALIRNCGVAIAISVFFAVARGPSHSPGPGDTLSVVAENHLDSTVSMQRPREYDRPPGSVCRLVDTEPPTSAKTP